MFLSLRACAQTIEMPCSYFERRYSGSALVSGIAINAKAAQFVQVFHDGLSTIDS